MRICCLQLPRHTSNRTWLLCFQLSRTTQPLHSCVIHSCAQGHIVASPQHRAAGCHNKICTLRRSLLGHVLRMLTWCAAPAS